MGKRKQKVRSKSQDPIPEKVTRATSVKTNRTPAKISASASFEKISAFATYMSEPEEPQSQKIRKKQKLPLETKKTREGRNVKKLLKGSESDDTLVLPTKIGIVAPSRRKSRFVAKPEKSQSQESKSPKETSKAKTTRSSPTKKLKGKTVDKFLDCDESDNASSLEDLPLSESDASILKLDIGVKVDEEFQLHVDSPFSEEDTSILGLDNSAKTGDGPQSLEVSGCDSGIIKVKILPLTPERSKVLLGLEKDVQVFGCGSLKVLKGGVSLLGFNFLPESREEKFFAPTTDPALVLQPILNCNNTERTLEDAGVVETLDSLRSEVEDFVTSFPTVLLLSSITESESLKFPGYSDVFKLRQEDGAIVSELSKGLYVVDTKRHFQCFPSYISTCQEICRNSTDHKTNYPVVLTVGGKGSGKSTFNRFLVNQLLGCYPCVNYIDCDIGQPEFTPPGFISLTSIKSPILGPPFTHVKHPDFAVYFGCITSAKQPDRYVTSIVKVLDKMEGKCPTVINSMGWIRGLGLSLLTDLVKLAQPTHVVQMSSKKMPLMTKDYVEQSDGWNTLGAKAPDFGHIMIEAELPNREIIVYKPSDRRILRTLAYLEHMQQCCSKRNSVDCTVKLKLSALCSQKPFRVNLNDVALCVSHEPGIPKAYSLPILNTALVALCTVSRDVLEDLQGSECLGAPPACECHGLGLVRGVDKEHGCLYIISHLPEKLLRNVNCLSIGTLSVPECMFDDSKDVELGSIPPYVSEDFPFYVTGSSKFRVYRSFVK